MKGTSIIVSSGSSAPRGVFDECTINGTPYPGTVMEMDDSVASVANVFTWQAYGTTGGASGQGVENDGDRKIIAILLENSARGGAYNRIYADGERGFLYFPAMGETFNMLTILQGDVLFVGQEFMVDDDTGSLTRADLDAESQPFSCLQVATGLEAAPYWHWFRFNGAV